MIKNFKCKDTALLFEDKYVAKFSEILNIARRKLVMLHAAISINSLKVPPGNKLEKLKGDRKDQYSIRINNQYRICFKWVENNAVDVEIVDYH
jgi:proteic killer suppression protein